MIILISYESIFHNSFNTFLMSLAPLPTTEEILLGPQRYFSLMKSTSLVDLIFNSNFGSNYEWLAPIFYVVGVLLMDGIMHIFQAFIRSIPSRKRDSTVINLCYKIYKLLKWKLDLSHLNEELILLLWL